MYFLKKADSEAAGMTGILLPQLPECEIAGCVTMPT